MNSVLPKQTITRAQSGNFGRWLIRFALAAYIVVMTGIILIAYVQAFRASLLPDEGIFSEIGRLIAQEDGLPYRDAWDHKPPLVYYWLASFITIFGNTLIAVRLAAFSVSVLFAGSITAFIYQGTRSTSATLLGTLLATAYSALLMFAFGIETGFLMTALGVTAMLIVVAGRGRTRWMVAGGLLFAAGFFAKQPLVTNAPVLLLLAYYYAPQRRIRAVGWVIAGGLLGLGLVVAWAVANGIVREFWEQAFAANFDYVNGNQTATRFNVGPMDRHLFETYFLGWTLPFLAPLLIMALPAAMVWFRQRSSRPLLAILVLWFVTSFLGGSIGRAWTLDYFIQTLPPLILLLALAVPSLERLNPDVQTALILGLTGLVGLASLEALARDRPDRASAATNPVIDYVIDHTSPDDCLWTWGHLGEINYLTARRSCTRQLQEGALMGNVFDVRSNRVQYMHELITSEPALHVRSSAWDYFPQLQRYAGRYLKQRVPTTSGIEVYEVDRSLWQPLDVHFADTIALIGLDMDNASVQPGAELHLSLTWRVLEPPDKLYNMFVHVVTADEQTRLAQYDGLPSTIRPTPTWMTPGETILGDRITLTLPADIDPGQVRLISGFYDVETLEPLPVIAADGHQQAYAVLADITVEPRTE